MNTRKSPCSRMAAMSAIPKSPAEAPSRAPSSSAICSTAARCARSPTVHLVQFDPFGRRGSGLTCTAPRRPRSPHLDVREAAGTAAGCLVPASGTARCGGVPPGGPSGRITSLRWPALRLRTVGTALASGFRSPRRAACRGRRDLPGPPSPGDVVQHDAARPAGAQDVPRAGRGGVDGLAHGGGRDVADGVPPCSAGGDQRRVHLGSRATVRGRTAVERAGVADDDEELDGIARNGWVTVHHRVRWVRRAAGRRNLHSLGLPAFQNCTLDLRISHERESCMFISGVLFDQTIGSGVK